VIQSSSARWYVDVRRSSETFGDAGDVHIAVGFVAQLLGLSALIMSVLVDDTPS
jgi:hypothetical protein